MIFDGASAVCLAMKSITCYIKWPAVHEEVS